MLALKICFIPFPNEGILGYVHQIYVIQKKDNKG